VRISRNAARIVPESPFFPIRSIQLPLPIPGAEFDPGIINSRATGRPAGRGGEQYLTRTLTDLSAHSRYARARARARGNGLTSGSAFFSLQLCVDMYNLGNYIASLAGERARGRERARERERGRGRARRAATSAFHFMRSRSQLIGTDCYLSS